ncbi:MAG: DUF192 domain-containing protein [Candidatus Cloacimonas sp.]|nr:DUF192 domain-containing protein [Candidatus Cloacimonadota bacterium]
MRNRRSSNHRKKKSGYNIKKIILYSLALIAIIFIYGYLSKAGHKQPVTMTEDKAKEPVFRKDTELSFFNPDGSMIRSIDIEIADTDETRLQGLMYRTVLLQNQGMLFIFPRTEIVSMWMQNTYIPLDMIFVRENKTVSEIITASTTHSERFLISEEECRYVIEVNAGFAEANGIREGCLIAW